ncbi:ATP-binding protein [Emcibacter sp. SYSU 3D8]|uniref:ATP-binding protein n=1 Tax=Emcibacter sp. SYSU 3D8 TaxID=3133969 RepID=UPI0031FEF07D
MTRLIELVQVERRFARSARLDTDLQGAPPLVGYVMQPSVNRALEAMTDGLTEAGQAAFTWTGPYGGGKSCAALLVASLVAGEAEQRALAARLAGPELVERFAAAFPETGKGWAVLALTGRRAELRNEIAEAGAITFGWSKDDTCKLADDDRLLIAKLESEALERDGVLLLIDEMGKFLEYSVAEGGDVHLLQDLAERASRSKGRLVVVGLLHQSFEQYANKLGKTSRNEWAKIQGRYLNIPFVAQADEVAALIARAVQVKTRPSAAKPLAVATADAVAKRRTVDAEALAGVLEASWPLHPVTTLLLGPVSRQRFAQNERSVFGFLASAEPHGFQSHLAAMDVDAADPWFGPDQLWDYLVANFGSALAVGVDGTQLSLAIEAVERAALRGALHARLAKSAALIEFFRNGSGLAVTDDILTLCAPAAKASEIEEAIAELVERAVFIRQPRLGGYALFAGSDFDLDEAITNHRERLDSETLADLPARLQIGPIAAKRHYMETGALRTFDVVLQLGEEVSVDLAGWAQSCAERLARGKRKASGILVLLLPDGASFKVEPEKAAKELSTALAARGLIAAVGAAKSVYMLRDHGADLYAIDRLEVAHPQLEGDRIARRELAARRSQVLEAVRRELLSTFASASWYSCGAKLQGLDGSPLSMIASMVARTTFDQAPIVHSELLYRDKPSTNAMAALRALAYAMVSKGSEPDLGMIGYPPERGLYLTILRPLGLHRPDADGVWRFSNPEDAALGASLQSAWEVALAATSLQLDELYRIWGRPPFGVKRGVMPILALAYLLAHRASVAVYLEGIFQPQLDEVFVDRLLQDPSHIEFRRIRRSGQDSAFINALAHLLSLEGETLEAEALPVAARLYQRFRALPQWAQRTQQLTERARRIRDVVVKASDPEALLFTDLMDVLKEETDLAVAVTGALEECEAAFPRMLSELKEGLAEQLGVAPGTFEGLGPRTVMVTGVTGDLRFDAFAMRAGTLEAADGDIEGLASLLVHKPPRSWTDREQQQALFELSKLTRRFREAEALAAIKGRDPTAQAISLVVGLDPRSQPLFHTFEVTEQERQQAERLADTLLYAMRGEMAAPTHVELAAIAQVIERLSAQLSEAA